MSALSLKTIFRKFNKDPNNSSYHKELKKVFVNNGWTIVSINRSASNKGPNNEKWYIPLSDYSPKSYFKLHINNDSVYVEIAFRNRDDALQFKLKI